MTTDPQCRSTSPADDVCTKPRGHRSRFHQGRIPGKRTPTRRWTGGIRTQAFWERDEEREMSDGVLQGLGRRCW